MVIPRAEDTRGEVAQLAREAESRSIFDSFSQPLQDVLTFIYDQDLIVHCGPAVIDRLKEADARCSGLDADSQVAALMKVVAPLFADASPEMSSPFQNLTGLPESDEGSLVEPTTSVLLKEVSGVKILLMKPETTFSDGGLYVGKGCAWLAGSPLQEKLYDRMDVQEVREALQGRPLYVVEDEVALAEEIIRHFHLSGLSLPSAMTWEMFSGFESTKELTVCEVGVALKLFLRLRPGKLGTFVRLFPCCALGNFKRSPPELMPFPLPFDTLAELEVMEAFKRWYDPLSKKEETEGPAASVRQQAGVDAWCWLQCVLLNYMYCGGPRLLGATMFHPKDILEHQHGIANRCHRWATLFCKGEPFTSIKPWHLAAESLGGMYTGEEVVKAHKLTWAAIERSVPPSGEAARVKLADVVPPVLKPFAESPDLLRLPEDEVKNFQASAKVLVESDAEYDLIIRNLVKAGMMDAEVPEETVTHKGQRVTNGMFGVHKAWLESAPGEWQRVLRLIINLIPTNSLQRRLPQRSSSHMGYAPLWGRMVLLEDEVMMCFAEDQRYCFHIYRPGDKWRGWFVIGKAASADCFGLTDGVRRCPRVCSAPMGWSNIVDFIQSAHEQMGEVAGMHRSQMVQLGLPLPQRDFMCPRDWFSFYVDNFDQGKVVVRSRQGIYEGHPSEEQLKLREVYKVWEVGRDAKKAAEGTLEWTSLGAQILGDEGLVGSALNFRHVLLGGNLFLIIHEDRPMSLGAELLTTISKNMHSVQFNRLLGCLFDKVYDVIYSAEATALGLDGGDELLCLTLSLPMHWMDMRMKIDPHVYATDASMEGAGACASVELTAKGRAKLHQLCIDPDSLEGGVGDSLLVIEAFGGMGGLSQALQLLGVTPVGAIFIDLDLKARKLSKHMRPFALTVPDIQHVSRDTVMDWRRSYPKVKKVLVGGGWPCVNHSRLNVGRGGADAPSSLLLDNLLQLADWLKEAPNATGTEAWEVIEFYENVVMDEEDLKAVIQKIGIVPFKCEAHQMLRCRRPRLFWLRGLPLIRGSDVTVASRDLSGGGDPVGSGPCLLCLDLACDPPPLGWFLEDGARKVAKPDEPFATFTRPLKRQAPPPSPAGIDSASPAALRRWKGDAYRLQPYQYEDHNLVVDQHGPRVPRGLEKARMMGFLSNCFGSLKFTEDEMGQFVGNSFPVPVVARLLAGLVCSEDQASHKNLCELIWQSWRAQEMKIRAANQLSWKERFGVDRPVDDPLHTVKAHLKGPLPPPPAARKSLMSSLSEEEFLIFGYSRLAATNGADIRLDLGLPYGPHQLARTTIDPSSWTWKVILSYSWKNQNQHINVLETVAVLDLLRKLGRDKESQGKRRLILIDNQAALGVLAKGRSSSKAMMAPLTRISAILIAGHMRLILGWVRTDWNPADGPSRWAKKRQSSNAA